MAAARKPVVYLVSLIIKRYRERSYPQNLSRSHDERIMNGCVQRFGRDPDRFPAHNVRI